jgi:transcriptional regulator with XRE-family HTH domain
VKSTADSRYLEVAARLRAARRSLGLSQADLARRLGKPQSYVSKVERCGRRVDVVETIMLCEALGVTLDHILPLDLQGRANGRAQ